MFGYHTDILIKWLISTEWLMLVLVKHLSEKYSLINCMKMIIAKGKVSTETGFPCAKA